MHSRSNTPVAECNIDDKLFVDCRLIVIVKATALSLLRQRKLAALLKGPIFVRRI
jgi:hypothetical protein